MTFFDLVNLRTFIIVFLWPYNFSFARIFLRGNDLQVEYELTFRSFCYTEDGRFGIYLRHSINDCVAECSVRSVCKLLQYNSRTHLCELYTSMNETVNKRGCVSVERNDLVIKQFPCGDDCNNGTSCDLVSKQCVFEECLGFPSAENGEIVGNLKQVGSMVRLQCNDGFEVNEGPTTSVCQANGSWSILTLACTSSIPLKVTFRCPESDNVYTSVSLDDGVLFTYRFVHDVKLEHEEAFEYCQADDAQLIQTFPESKRNVLRSLMRECSTSYRGRYWIDGNNKNAEDYGNVNEWVTSTGEPLVTDFWGPGEPNKPFTDHCAYLYMEKTSHNNLISDWLCGDNYYFVCEK